jgi:predicted RNase H-like nuclease
MTKSSDDLWLAGVDGCRRGWLAVLVRPDGKDVCISDVIEDFAEILSAPKAPAIIAVDMPIGLPETGGRAAETIVRPRLGKLSRSVFPVPSRQAVFSEIGRFENEMERYAAHRRACLVAEATSNPPKRIPMQTFGIFPKIRKLDEYLRTKSNARERVYEVHPELAFWRLNGDCPLDMPKKKKGRPYEPGLALRRALLIASGLSKEAVNAAPPKGAGADDLLDALACAAVARRIHAGIAQPFPDPPPRDAFGLPMAIWA